MKCTCIAQASNNSSVAAQALDGHSSKEKHSIGIGIGIAQILSTVFILLSVVLFCCCRCFFEVLSSKCPIEIKIEISFSEQQISASFDQCLDSTSEFFFTVFYQEVYHLVSLLI